MKKFAYILVALFLLPALAMGADLSAELTGSESAEQGFISISTDGNVMTYTVMTNGMSPDRLVLMSGGNEVLDFGAAFNGNYATGSVVADSAAIVANPSAYSVVVEGGSPIQGALVLAGGVTGLQTDVARRNFGESPVGTTAARKKVVVTNNNESGRVTINTAGVFGPNKAQYDLVLNECDGVSLAAGASCRIFLEFTPAAVGTRKALLQILSNDETNPEIRVQLRGDGI